MVLEKQPRPVNRAVGLPLKVGTIPLGQLALIGALGFLLLYLTLLLRWPYYSGLLLFALLSGTTLALLGDRPWLFLHKFAPSPKIVRGGAYYYPLLPDRGKRDTTGSENRFSSSVVNANSGSSPAKIKKLSLGQETELKRRKKEVNKS